MSIHAESVARKKSDRPIGEIRPSGLENDFFRRWRSGDETRDIPSFLFLDQFDPRISRFTHCDAHLLPAKRSPIDPGKSQDSLKSQRARNRSVERSQINSLLSISSIEHRSRRPKTAVGLPDEWFKVIAKGRRRFIDYSTFFCV